MTAPSAVPLWQDEPYTPRAPLDRDLDVDVCIVGAGVGGLATAWHLAERGVEATVVEAREVASGASGRNGGFVIAGAAAMHNDARAAFGADLARRLHRATVDAREEVHGLADAIGAGRLFGRTGIARVAMDAAEAEHLRDQAAALREDGFGGEVLEEADLPVALRRPGRLGLLTPRDGGAHPARWLRRLAALLEERGVRILERTPVATPLPEPLPDGSRVLATPAGRIRAARVVAAADGALPVLVPLYGGRGVRTRRLHVVATAPVGREVLPWPVYPRYGYEYAQQLPDGRIVLGGFSDLDGAASYTDREQAAPAVHGRLERYLREELGVGAPVTHAWVGLVGYGGDRRPFAGSVPGTANLWALGSYDGTGNLNGWVAGRIVAELLATGSSADGDLYDAGRAVRP